MQITTEPHDSYTILHLRGEFDTFYCASLQKEIEALGSAGVIHVVLNLRLVKFINSTALGAILKSGKQLAAQKGKLVIARPSTFCRDIIEKVGLDRVVPIYDTDEAAGAAVVAGRQSSAGKASEIIEDETAILFGLVDSERVELFLTASKRPKPPPGAEARQEEFGASWRGLGRMSALDAENLRFTWNGGNTGLTAFEMGQMLSIGTKLSVRFKLPLLQKGHCEATVAVTEVEERPDGVKVVADFIELDPASKKAVQQYAADMAFLKKELRKATKG